jgi:hypothetical protein
VRRLAVVALSLIGWWLAPAVSPAAAALPGGYLVWVKGTAGDPGSRRITRLTLPDRTDERALTAGEDIEPQVSPDGQWVAYAKAKFPGGSDYHDPGLWKLYLVSIHGAGQGRREIKIDDDGAWPSWGRDGSLYYNQADGTHTRLQRVEIDRRGQVIRRQTVLSTRQAFGGFVEVNELAMAPDGTWFAARTRGNATQNGVGAFALEPPASLPLARAGDIGCMPRVAPDGSFGLIAGAAAGVRWGHGPQVGGGARKEDQLLIPVRSPAHLAYHPGISSDGRWVLAAQGTEPDHNGGRYDLEIHELDQATMTIVAGESALLTDGGFNGWPGLWVGAGSAPPPPRPEVGTLEASRYTVAPGEAVTVSWTTFGADQVTLDGAAVDPVGSQERRPAASIEVTLVARSSSLLQESDSRTLMITVNSSPQPVQVASFVAVPERLERGQSAVLRWQVRNATTLDLDGVPVPPQGEREVTPLATTTYLLTAQGQDGPALARATVTVGERSTGLLPDRGGFRCAAAPAGDRAPAPPSRALLAVLMLVLLPALALLRTATTRGPARRTRSPRRR